MTAYLYLWGYKILIFYIIIAYNYINMIQYTCGKNIENEPEKSLDIKLPKHNQWILEL